ncbi:hypothetical protein Lser_V15G33129 [Lactuca serriola]
MQLMSSLDQNGTNSSKNPRNNMNQCIISFNYSEFKSATKNFGNDTLLSDTRYGKIYRGFIDTTTYSRSEDNARLSVAINRLERYECAD